MITSKQYLKDLKSMNEMEKKEYYVRVNRWTSDTFPELLALAECWEKVPVKDFDEGCILVSAIINARPFLNDVQRYSAKVAIKKLNLYLEKVRRESGLAKRATRGPVGVEKFRAIVPEEPLPDENGDPQPVRQYVEPEVNNRRPKDFVLYKDKLPKALQQKGEKWLKDAYLELADYRGRLEVMAETPQVSDEARKDMADKVLATEQQIRAFWAEVDAAYNGEVSPSSDADNGEYLSGMKRPGDFTREEIEAMTDEKQQEICRKARIDGNKKYINRNDVKITDEYREQLSLRIRELMAWGENLPRKTAEVATGAGVFIEGVNKEDKQEISENKKEISKTEEKVSENPKKTQETAVPTAKAVDPTESVTESSIQKTQKGAAK
ncbi:hypothetical protein H6A66_11185 [Bacteroides caecigallinarum]|uniref:hypothetical protein n=1 Tax=Bacteroides caecigallinarum TaxID=1411144 RepID=UPI001959E515|nr:hypothetical protein [Bacteroides caecigallinarum]MBM6865727.1 hypothetical protein [Bacteroides caecigallinarum]